MVAEPVRNLHRLLADPSRQRLLELVRAGRATDVHTLSQATGLHVTTVRSHLQQLVDAGLVTAAATPRGARGRPRVTYTAGEPVDADGHRPFVEALVDGLAATPAGPEVSERAGMAWGRRLSGDMGDGPDSSPVSSLLTVMQRLGFDPSLDEHGNVLLRSCPVLQMARRHRDVVCGLHRGVARGVLAGSIVDVADLVPFATPETCTLSLRTRRAQSIV